MSGYRGTQKKISCSYKYINELLPGQIILISDGMISCEVTHSNETSVFVKVLNDGVLGPRKNINIPGHKVKLPTITDQDEDDITDFAAVFNVDYIAASFVRSAEDVKKIRSLLGNKADQIKVISKIESIEGIENFEEILEVSDGIMIARGDLGMAIPSEKIFIAQKYMIDMANIAGKPVFTATQMMESMIQNPRPTRAESTDVANAVLDGSDCVTLSGETANGLYPVKTIEIMAKICNEAEEMINYQKVRNSLYQTIQRVSKISQLESQCLSAIEQADRNNASLIVTFTKSGRIVQLLAKYRPKQSILAYCYNEKLCNTLTYHRGVRTFRFTSELDNSDEIPFERIRMYVTFKKIALKGDTVIFLTPIQEDLSDSELSIKFETF